MIDDFKSLLKKLEDGECTHVQLSIEEHDPVVSLTFMMMGNAGALLGIHYAVIQHHEIIGTGGPIELQHRKVYHFYPLTDEGREQATTQFLKLAENARKLKDDLSLTIRDTGEFMTFGPQDYF